MKSKAYNRADKFLEEALEQLGLDGDKYDHANQSSNERGYGPDDKGTRAAITVTESELYLEFRKAQRELQELRQTMYPSHEELNHFWFSGIRCIDLDDENEVYRELYRQWEIAMARIQGDEE